MDRAVSGRWRAVLGAGIAAGAVLAVMTVWGTPEATSAQQVSRFMGGNPSQEELGDLRTMRLRFPAGSRSNWHTHTDGQLLMIEQGRGLHQVRGQPVYEMRPGEPWWTPAGVEHWHGAHPDEASLQLTIYAGSVEWLEPVPDEQYRVPARRP